MPSFAKLVNDFKKKGVDEVACISINDPYCMDGWAAAMGTSGINFYADADETFTRAVEETRDCTADALGPAAGEQRVMSYAMSAASALRPSLLAATANARRRRC